MAKKKKLDKLIRKLGSKLNVKKEVYEMPAIDWGHMRENLSKPQLDIFNSNASVSLFLGGQGSGKTHLAGCIALYRVATHPDSRGMICANTYQQISQSTLFRIREVWKEHGWTEYNEQDGTGEYVVGIKPPHCFNTETHNYDRYNNIISFRSGAIIYYGSLDNYKALDGKEVGWSILDETKDTKEEAVKDVILGRLRQQSSLGYNPLLLITSPAKSPWINEWFELERYETKIKKMIFSEVTYFNKKIDNKSVVIASTFHNSANLPSDYIQNQIKNLSSDRAEMLVYGSPFSKSGGEFYKGFDRKNHVAKLKYNPDLPLHISFDFNVHPYVTLCVWQMVAKTEGYQLRQIGEHCLSSPKNNTRALCLDFIKTYQGHVAGLFIYGDPAGKHQDTRSEKGYNDYTIIMAELERFKPILKLESRAPAVVMRGNFINQIFEQELYGISINIDSSCIHTLADYSYLKEAADGTKQKTRERKNGISYEKYGHCSDANDYFITTVLKVEFQKYLRGGKERKKMLFGLFSKNKDR